MAAADPVLARYRDWLRAEVGLAGVTVVTGARRHRRPTCATRTSTRWSLATGPVWSRPEVAGASRVRTPPELARRARRRCDTAGDGRRSSVAASPGSRSPSRLRARGAAVTVVEPTAVFGTELGLPGRWRMVADAEAAGITLVGRRP